MVARSSRAQKQEAHEPAVPADALLAGNYAPLTFAATRPLAAARRIADESHHWFIGDGMIHAFAAMSQVLLAQFVAPVLSITFPSAKQISISPRQFRWRDKMCTFDLSAAILRAGRPSYRSQSQGERVTPVDVYKESIKPFATGPLFLQPRSPPFWRY